MTRSDIQVRRVERDIEVRDLLARPDHERRSFTADDLDEAYARGVADARAQMTMEREDAVRSLAASLDQAVKAQERALDDLRMHYRNQVVDDAFALAAWLVGREVTTNPDVMRARVDEALNGIDDDNPQLTVAPCVAELVAEWLPAATVRADATLHPGEIVVSAASSTIDGTFGDALERVRAAFTGEPTGVAR
jgi:flagellar biosynthesis/type III secretory pathway protein FliH